jgi:hypothetical protein
MEPGAAREPVANPAARPPHSFPRAPQLQNQWKVAISGHTLAKGNP